MEGFNLKNTFFSCITIIVLVLSMLFFYEPAQNLLCSYAIFERFLINTPKVCSLFDTTRLSRYNGVDGGKIYLSILGIVFDVTEGRRFYGPGGSYSGFSGRDASRSFITGLFDEENLTDHVSDMDPNDLIGLDTWLNTYKKKYKEIGKLIGRYYDSSGKETDYSKLVYEKIKSSKMAKATKNKEMARYPSCNIEYVQENQKSKVWCTTLSGGIKRNWIGVPRKLQSLDENGKLSFRCACVQLDTLSQAELVHINEYEGCDASATTCYVKVS
ncbi:neuferricin-like [Rhopalosiphum maidis]|uniref:neuferricin-like n=1 Tax=Rhopalosiphum maidis TaxID=43146 RepID=UPI000F005294|nr:neuferricin-like [Rhopalosiphum maidis]XP_026813814.1 neuferricin-like [Rhopalosiphum maidis]